MTPGNWVVICVLAILAAFLAYGFSFDLRRWWQERQQRIALARLRHSYEDDPVSAPWAQTADPVDELEFVWSQPSRVPWHERGRAS